MSLVTPLAIDQWSPACSPESSNEATDQLEEGRVLFLPALAFPLLPEERGFLSPTVGGRSKNIGFNIATGQVRGTALQGEAARQLQTMLMRYAQSARSLVDNLLASYRGHLRQARTSFRPVEVAGRRTSWRKDDTRLHVDSFPASPVRDQRILRVFTNANPAGQTRDWRLGEPFEAVAERILPRLRAPLPGSAALLQALHITKSRRSPYDHYMLGLHDSMKADLRYQAEAPQEAMAFPAGSTWIVFSDHVSHAAMAGQYLFEQTFYLPVDAMRNPARSPLRTLERMTGRALV